MEDGTWKMENKEKTIFFGSSKYVIPTIEMLNAGFGLALVVTTEKDPLDAVPSFCSANNIPYLSVKNLKDENVLEQIKNEKALVGVLGYFGLIVPQELLDMFPKGIINIHPSLLPKYRGPTPVQTATLNGDSETGTSIILLDKEVDHGPMLIQKKLDIDPVDTTDSLHAKLFSLGAELIKEVLPIYLADGIALQAQDHSAATFTKHLSKQSGQFEVDNPPNKEKLDRMIRAYFPWPTVWTVLSVKGKALRVKFLPYSICHPERSEGSLKDSSAKPQNDKGFCLQVEGGKPMGVKDFQNGYPDLKQFLQKII